MSRTSDQPSFWIFAGPNGSGKTSAYSNTDFEEDFRSIWIINPDALSARILNIEGMDSVSANLQAVQRIELGSRPPSWRIRR